LGSLGTHILAGDVNNVRRRVGALKAVQNFRQRGGQELVEFAFASEYHCESRNDVFKIGLRARSEVDFDLDPTPWQQPTGERRVVCTELGGVLIG